MATRSLRNKSSRYSSPAVFGEKEPAPKPIEDLPIQNGQQSSLDAWIEPSLRAPAPSFEDTRGLERVGVLENMQPLGTAPTQRLLQKLKLNYARPSPRATPAHVVGEEVMPVAESAEKMELASSMEEAATTRQPEIFQDQQPVYSAPPDAMMISSPPRGRPPGRLSNDMPLPIGMSPSSGSYPLAPYHYASPKPLSIQQQLRQDRLRNHVDRAIQEAQQRNTPDLVQGLQRIRGDALFNYDLWNVVEAIMTNSTTPDQFKIFKRYIKSGVKQHRRDSQMSASPYQASPQGFHNLNSPDRRDRSPNMNHPQIMPSLPPTDHTNAWLNHQVPDQVAPDAYSSQPLPELPTTAASQLDVPETNGRSKRQTAVTSPHKRKRSGSVSSSSSLSSLSSTFDGNPPAPWDESEEPAGGWQAGSAGQRQAAGRGTGGSRLRSAFGATDYLPQPASGQLQSKLVVGSRSNSNKRFKKNREDSEYDIDELSKRKRHYLDDSFHDYNTIPRPESDEREIVHGHPTRPVLSDNPPPPVIHPNRLFVARATFASLITGSEQPGATSAREASRKRVHDDIDVDDLDLSTPASYSPDSLLVPPPPPGVVGGSSRAATPRTTRHQAVQKTRKSARVMVSPNKPKNGGITAGISRAGPGRDAHQAQTQANHDSGAEDNDEFCASCSGEGKLLCCDGCTNSFHHACLEPPLNPEEEVDGEWYCPRCVARRNKGAPSPVGLLGMAIGQVDDVIPKAYTLPLEIRDYFEGVRTGEEGEYDEVSLPRTQINVGKMNRAGFIEEPNYKETRDSKGNMIRCYQCNLTSNGRDIIPCDFCPAKWHLDCIDPPLAVPPRRRAGDKPGAAWRCPLHVDQDLLSLSRQAEKAPGDMGRIPKPRRPKNAKALDIAAARGFRNGGVIDVELMADYPDPDKLNEIQMNGRVFRVPEMGIRLDFIDRVKKSWYEDQSMPRLMDAPKRIWNQKYRSDGAVLHHPPQQSIVKIREPDFFTGANALAITETAKANAALRRKSIREQQTVLSLANMSQRGIDGYSGDALAELTNQLISEAPDKVVRATERTEIDQLRQLQDLITTRLAVLGDSTSSAPAKADKRSRSSGKLNGNGIPPAQDPNIDPALRSGGFNVPPPAKTMAVPEIPFDPALHMTSTKSPRSKMYNGEAPDYNDNQDADDEEEAGDMPVTSYGGVSKAAYLANGEESRRWHGDLDLPPVAPPPVSPARYGIAGNHPLLPRGYGNGNGNGFDGMKMGP